MHNPDLHHHDRHSSLPPTSMGRPAQLAILLCTLLLSRCGVLTRNDIYEVYPIGSHLDAATLERANQLIVTSRHRILSVDLSDDVDRVEPHLLFYDLQLRLETGCYLPGYVSAVQHDTLFASVNEYLDDRAGAYRADLPPDIVIVYLPQTKGATGTRINKMLEKVEVRAEDMRIRLYVREADQEMPGLDWSPGRDTSGFASQYYRRDTFELELHELEWNTEERRLSRMAPSYRGLLTDHMIVPDETVWRGLFKDLYALISVDAKPDAPRPSPIPLAK